MNSAATSVCTECPIASTGGAGGAGGDGGDDGEGEGDDAKKDSESTLINALAAIAIIGALLA